MRVLSHKLQLLWPIGFLVDDFKKKFSLYIPLLIFEHPPPFVAPPYPLHQIMLCANFGLNWSSGSEEKVKNVKSLQTDSHRDAGQMLILLSTQVR